VPEDELKSPLGPYYRAEEFYIYCTQFGESGIEGSEDCLYLNVYIPRVRVPNFSIVLNVKFTLVKCVLDAQAESINETVLTETRKHCRPSAASSRLFSRRWIRERIWLHQRNRTRWYGTPRIGFCYRELQTRTVR